MFIAASLMHYWFQSKRCCILLIHTTNVFWIPSCKTIYLTTFFEEKIFRPVRTIAKSDYWLRHVCLSVRPSFLPSVLSASKNSAPTGRIFVKFNIWVFFENLSTISSFTGFSWNLIFEYFSKISQEFRVSPDFH